MGGIFFSHAALLAGLAALAVPILIHLLLKQKKMPLRFSTIQFFLKRDEKSLQRRKLRNLILLALRLLLLALLVLAFARPYLQESTAAKAARQRQQIVFLLDRSASMQAGNRWAKAKELMQQTVAGLNPTDRAALIDSGAQAEVLSPFVPPDALKSILQKTGPGFGTSDLAEGLKAAVRLLSQSGGGGISRIQVISDLQKNAVARIDEISVPKWIDLKISPAAETMTPNLAVEELTLDQSAGAIAVRVKNFSAQNAGDVKMNLSVDGVASAVSSLDIAAETSTQASLSLPRLDPGWHSMVASIEPHDSFALDDVRYQTLFIPKPHRVLCVEPRQSPHTFEEETFFVGNALAPETTNEGFYVVEKSTPEAAAAKLATGRDYALVVLPALREIPPDLARALKQFVNDGGGLIFFVGETVNGGRYNEEFRELLPAMIGHAEGDDERPENFWHLRDYERDGLMFAAFKEPNSGDVTLPEFRHRFTLTMLSGSRVEAGFDDGAPMIVSREFGRGRIVLVNTSADTTWTDWPKRKTFLPWLFGLAAYATQQTSPPNSQNDAPLLADFPADISLGTAAANLPLQVREPSGREISVIADAQGQVSLNPEQPGIYSIQNSVGQELRRAAVNLAAVESDLQSLAPDELKIPRSDDSPKPGLIAGFLGDNQRELWRIILLAAVAVLFIESLLANRSYA